jgi:hypothetical protein
MVVGGSLPTNVPGADDHVKRAMSLYAGELMAGRAEHVSEYRRVTPSSIE